MRYNVIQFVVNTSNQYNASVVATYDNVEGAMVRYHQLLASLHNASDVKTASAVIVNEYGRELSGYFEMVKHETSETSEATE
jgi:hypothetical protein